ncbi:hypothetical protein HHK36_019903 [Tetracentron sinense]|uniref:Pentatricopeptide repeat-containing protein n=1 Tax=Tetracentron sinense TaxID=13715 RepID=A0A834Z311_TETSI|nr:hypothetical protein HHK36_019903 [Tetracentron sinense]
MEKTDCFGTELQPWRSNIKAVLLLLTGNKKEVQKNPTPNEMISETGRERKRNKAFLYLQVSISSPSTVRVNCDSMGEMEVGLVLEEDAGAMEKQGMAIHDYILMHNIKADVCMRRSLIYMHCKCGCLEKALEVIQEMMKKDVVSWTSIISIFDVWLFKVHSKSQRCHPWKQKTLRKPPSCSPRSIGSNEFQNPTTHEVILSTSRCELKITGFGGFREGASGAGGGNGPTFVGTLTPGTPGTGGHHHSLRSSATLRNLMASSLKEKALVMELLLFLEAMRLLQTPGASLEKDSYCYSLTCPNCGEQFGK